MARFEAFAILILLSFCFFLFVNSEKTAELSSAEEKIPLEIFMKDEPRRRDSNEKSLRAMHLCMEEEDQKERLITCDRRYSSKFACVGAWEGNIQKCDKFNEKQVAAPICVQAESSYVLICEYKNLKSSYLCSPRNLKWMNDFKERQNPMKILAGMSKDIRPCGNELRRICLEQGALLPCNDIGQLDSKEDKINENFMTNTSKENISENYMAYETIKSAFDIPLFHDGISNVTYHTSIASDESTSNHKLKYETVDLRSSQTGGTKFLYPHERLVAYEFNADKKEPIADYTVLGSLSDTPFESYPLSEAHQVSGISDQDNSNPKFKYKKVKVLSPLRGHPKFPHHKGNIYDLESAINETARFHSPMQNIPSKKSIVSITRKSNRKLKYKTVNPLASERIFSKASNQQESVAALQSFRDKTGNSFDKISAFARDKLSSSSKTNYITDGKEQNIREPAFLTDGLNTSTGLNTKHLEHKNKMATSPTKYSMNSNPSGSPSMKSHWKSPNLNWRQGMKKSIEDRLPDRSVKHAKRALARLERYRTPGKIVSEEPCTEQQSETKELFYVVKCKDCRIKHTMLVDENAEDVIPEVETWTFKD